MSTRMSGITIASGYTTTAGTFLDAPQVAAMQASNTCSVNIDDACVAIKAPSQQAPLFCAANQPFSGNQGYKCSVNRGDLFTAGF